MSDDSQAATAVAEPETDQETRTERKARADSSAKPKKQPSYVLIVHNDEDHTWAYVIEVLQRVCGHNEEQAYLLTSMVHHQGKAPVWTGPLEVAELKRDQVRGFGPDFYAEQTVKYPLGVSIEPLPV